MGKGSRPKTGLQELADAGYSSGENYAWLEQHKLKSYIPPPGTYKGGPEGFVYIQEGNYWIVPITKKSLLRIKG